MITFKQTGDFSKSKKTLLNMQTATKRGILEKYGKAGVRALKSATPADSGVTADSWVYKIHHGKGYSSISFSNTNIHEGVNIAILLQYGHGTGTGGWVQGKDYINPAIRPVFDSIADSVWKEVTKHA